MVIMQKMLFYFWEKFWILTQKLVETNHWAIDQMLLLSVIKTNQVDHQSLWNFWQSQAYLCQDMNSLSGNFNINIVGILIELIEHIPEIELIGQHSQNLDLNVFYISRLFNLAIEILEILFILTLSVHVLNDVLDVLKNDESCFIGSVAFTSAH